MQDNTARVETLSWNDEEMFKAANKAGTGNLSIAEFAAYFGAEADDSTIIAKFVL